MPSQQMQCECAQLSSSCHYHTKSKKKKKSANGLRDSLQRGLCVRWEPQLFLSFFGVNICSGLGVSPVFPCECR